MNNRIAFFGKNEKNERLLIAIEFVEADKKVNIFTFGQEHLKEEFTKKMFKEWAESNKKVDFPEPHNKLEQSVLSGESLLPYEITSDKPETVRRAQNAWALRLLTSQLFENLKAELSLFGKKVDEAKEYVSENWAEAKKYASNLGVQLKDKNITKGNFDELKAVLDSSFEKLKVQLAKRNEELEAKSAVLVGELKQHITDYGEKMENISQNNKVFNDLKALHEKVKKAKITQAKRKELWDMLDGLFAKAKAKQKEYWNNRNDNRITGLQKAINRMENSINYDRKEIDFQKRRMNNSAIKSLEMQLRQAKLNVAEDKIKSKEEKLAEMHILLASLNKKKSKQPPAADKQKTTPDKKKQERSANSKSKEKAEQTAEKVAAESSIEKTPQPKTDVKAANANTNEGSAEQITEEVKKEKTEQTAEKVVKESAIEKTAEPKTDVTASKNAYGKDQVNEKVKIEESEPKNDNSKVIAEAVSDNNKDDVPPATPKEETATKDSSEEE